ncbi:MAG: diguanylate cyclase [Clostridia bacterium]|nr:diguanylate cyclase [Clostridia bacterium]
MLKILHLEESRFIKKKMGDIVESTGHFYYPANSPREAIETLEKEAIDLIVTALEFDGISGEDFIKTINNSKYKNIPIIVLTSTDTMEMREHLFSLGVVDYLVKTEVDDSIMTTYFKAFKQMKMFSHDVKDVNVAVLDDSELSLSLIRQIFELAGFSQVTYYSDPNEFMKDEKGYDVYIIDLILPGISGDELLLKLRHRHPKSVILIMSSVTNYKTISTTLLIGADDYIMKPFDANIFMARLKVQIKYYLMMCDLEEKNAELRKMAITDGLTKVYNRRYAMHRLEEEIARSERYKHSLSVIMFDLDNFKRVNDVYGHQVGDDVLVKLAQTCQDLLRSSDVMSRFGGEEFMIVLPEANYDQAMLVAEKIRVKIEALTFDDESLKVTISGGVNSFKNQSINELIRVADENLYKAKSSGKNCIIGS